MHMIALCRTGNTVSRAVALSKKITNPSQIYLNETNIFKFFLERLFWFTWQLSRISWTSGIGNKQCKFRQNIKWIGLENCRINNMTLKCLLRSTYSWVWCKAKVLNQKLKLGSSTYKSLTTFLVHDWIKYSFYKTKKTPGPFSASVLTKISYYCQMASPGSGLPVCQSVRGGRLGRTPATLPFAILLGGNSGCLAKPLTAIATLPVLFRLLVSPF